jgi:hypothetical protein
MDYLHQVSHLPCASCLRPSKDTRTCSPVQCVYQYITLLQFSIVASAMHLLYICIVDFALPKYTSLLELERVCFDL